MFRPRAFFYYNFFVLVLSSFSTFLNVVSVTAEVEQDKAEVEQNKAGVGPAEVEQDKAGDGRMAELALEMESLGEDLSDLSTQIDAKRNKASLKTVDQLLKQISEVRKKLDLVQ